MLSTGSATNVLIGTAAQGILPVRSDTKFHKDDSRRYNNRVLLNFVFTLTFMAPEFAGMFGIPSHHCYKYIIIRIIIILLT